MLKQVHPLWLWTVRNVEEFEKARRKYDERR
jgi:hypothetical protein